MKKLSLLFILILMYSFSLQAQEEKKNIIGLEVFSGPNFNFNSINSNFYKFKTRSSMIDIKLKYILSKNKGIVAMLSANYLGFTSKPLYQHNYYFNYSLGRFSLTSYMAGGYYDYYINKKLFIESKLLAGYVYSHHSALNLTFFPPEVPISIENTSNSFGINADTGIYYQTKPRFALGLNLNYYLIWLNFPDLVNGEDEKTIIVKYPSVLNLIAISLGIEFKF